MSSLAIAYLTELIRHPVRTKALTSGTFNALSEILGGVIAGQKDPETNSYIGPRVPKMALYGALVSGPLSHYLIDFIQKMFRHRKKGLTTNVLQIIAINLISIPALATTYIIWMSILAGARTWGQIKARIRASLWPVVSSQWITSPLLIAVAQKYVPKLAWTTFFSFFAFIMSTYHNTLLRKRLANREKKD